jgi:hypothetical protein
MPLTSKREAFIMSLMRESASGCKDSSRVMLLGSRALAPEVNAEYS